MAHAVDRQDALEFAEHAAPFDLLLTDLAGDGVEVVTETRVRRSA